LAYCATDQRREGKTLEANALKGKRAPQSRDKVAQATGKKARTLAARSPAGVPFNAHTDNFTIKPNHVLGRIEQGARGSVRICPRLGSAG
jgi:hypothetical protein